MAKKYMQAKKMASSGTVTTANKSGIVHAVTFRSGTSDGHILIRDGGASGTVKLRVSLDGTTNAGDKTESVSYGKNGILCSTDVYATLSGAATSGYVLYDEIEN